MKTQNLADFLIGNSQMNIFFSFLNENLNGKKIVPNKDNEAFYKVLHEREFLKDGFLTEKGLSEAKNLKPESLKDMKLTPDFWDKLKKFELPKDEKPKGNPAPQEAENPKKEVLEMPKDELQKILEQIKTLQNQVQTLQEEQKNVKNMTIFDIQERIEEYYLLRDELEGLQSAKKELDLFIKKLNNPANEEDCKITLICGNSSKTIRVHNSVQKCAELIDNIAAEQIHNISKEMEALTPIL